MLYTGHRRLSAFEAVQSTALLTRREEVDALHRQCGIYTKPDVVAEILDAVGWQDRFDLSQFRLLEPAAGDGAFVTEAARRLLTSCRKRSVAPRFDAIKDCIRAFEIHPREARRARQNVVTAIREFGIHHTTAGALARTWISTADFLLSRPSVTGFTHAVGNPPYVRWAKVPEKLRRTYSERLSREMIGGDLFLPFLDHALKQLRWQGRCGFLCSDRWRFMAFAENFRTKWLPQLDIVSEESLLAMDAYVREVDAYPSILIARRTHKAKSSMATPAIRSSKTIKDFDFKIKVGPALGHTPAFVLDEDEDDAEPALLLPWIDTSEVADGSIIWRKRRVIEMHGDEGKLIDLKQFPMALRRLGRFKSELSMRSIVRNGSPWFRPIDRICASDWAAPKLLIPEIAKVPRVAIDRSGAIPSHGIYAIFAPNGKIDTLYEQLVEGGLARALEGIAPKIKGGYVRCYKRFLEQIVLR
jgi:hypothetical protein